MPAKLEALCLFTYAELKIVRICALENLYDKIMENIKFEIAFYSLTICEYFSPSSYRFLIFRMTLKAHCACINTRA